MFHRQKQIAGVILFFAVNFAWAADQYKRHSRQWITQIAKGKAEKALENAQNFLKRHPGDLETLFVQALAYADTGRMDPALEAVEKALEGGLPFGRFLAGPRSLAEKLYANERFQKLRKPLEKQLIHGPVVGSVTGSSARFWVRTADETGVVIRVSTSRSFDSYVESREVETAKERDYTAVLEVKGLKPDTEYFYAVRVSGEPVNIEPQPAFRTFPKLGKPCRFEVGFGGGAGYTPWHERMWETILSEDPVAFLLLGDNVYIDTPKVRQTQRYCYYRRQSRPEYRRFAASTSVFAIWDDHDFGTNDCCSSLSLDKPEWKLPVLEVFKQSFVNPAYGVEGCPGCFFSFSIGDVDFFLLDCRFYRQNVRKFEQPSMLGPCQKEWLFEGLKASDAAFKVLASSVPWAAGVKPGSKDTWDGFPEEREEIFSFLERNRIGGVVLICADRHRSDARRIRRENGYDLYDLESSKLTNVHTHGLIKNAKGSEWLFGYNKKCSYGLLSFDTEKSDPEVTYRVINIEGKVVETLTLKRSRLAHKKK